MFSRFQIEVAAAVDPIQVVLNFPSRLDIGLDLFEDFSWGIETNLLGKPFPRSGALLAVSLLFGKKRHDILT